MEKKKCMKPYTTVQKRIKTYITGSKYWFLDSFMRFNPLTPKMTKFFFLRLSLNNLMKKAKNVLKNTLSYYFWVCST